MTIFKPIAELTRKYREYTWDRKIKIKEGAESRDVMFEF